jgi:hypothetical protein
MTEAGNASKATPEVARGCELCRNGPPYIMMEYSEMTTNVLELVERRTHVGSVADTPDQQVTTDPWRLASKKHEVVGPLRIETPKPRPSPDRGFS